jgi:hypothetical protein
MWRGLFTRHMPFLRTPKMEQAKALVRALGSTREETLMLLALWLAAGAVLYQHGSNSLDLLLWIIVLLVQSIPYLAALLMSIISAFPGLPAGLVCGRFCEEQQDASNGMQSAG